MGDNTRLMLLKGATPDHEGDERPDRWPLDAGAGGRRRALGDRPRARPRRTARGAAFSSGPLQQLGAVLQRFGVLGAGVVEALGVLAESLLGPRAGVVGRCRRRVAARGVTSGSVPATPVGGCRRRRPRARPAPRAPPSERVSAGQRSGLRAGASISWSPFTSRNSTENSILPPSSPLSSARRSSARRTRSGRRPGGRSGPACRRRRRRSGHRRPRRSSGSPPG